MGRHVPVTRPPPDRCASQIAESAMVIRRLCYSVDIQRHNLESQTARASGLRARRSRWRLPCRSLVATTIPAWRSPHATLPSAAPTSRSASRYQFEVEHVASEVGHALDGVEAARDVGEVDLLVRQRKRRVQAAHPRDWSLYTTAYPRDCRVTTRAKRQGALRSQRRALQRVADAEHVHRMSDRDAPSPLFAGDPCAGPRLRSVCTHAAAGPRQRGVRVQDFGFWGFGSEGRPRGGGSTSPGWRPPLPRRSRT
jgi:hypothetical protein